VVDDEVDRHLRVDLLRIAAELHGRIAHGGEVDHGRNAGKVLHQHAGRAVGDLVIILALVVEPLLERENVVLGDGLAIFEAQHVFQQHFQRGRQSGNIAKTVLGGGLD
jgi:hypothetical protein